MTDTQNETRQHTAKPFGVRLELIPPLASEFSVYGGPETVERVRQWAISGRYLLCDGIPKCAHGLYLMDMCPAHGCWGNASAADGGLDHANVWVQDRGRHVGAFLLSHPYHKQIRPGTRVYADAHGLRIEDDWPGDDWYGSGTIAIRMSVPENWPLWPIEREAETLLSTQPVAWPDDEDGLSKREIRALAAQMRAGQS